MFGLPEKDLGSQKGFRYHLLQKNWRCRSDEKCRPLGSRRCLVVVSMVLIKRSFKER